MHSNYMSLALQLAEQGRFTVSPNPMVGCVLVKGNEIVGQGYHQKSGDYHAEIYALQAAGEKAKDATAYITLEPCCHYGKTPPCIEALIAADVKKVYVACLDPNPLVAGKGVKGLIEAGIEVEVGLLGNEARRLNEIFFHYMTYKRPFVICKWAMSLDGKTITHNEDERQISGEQSQRHTHQIRSQVDAILVGANTARADNPKLTARLAPSIKQPHRIVISSDGNLLPTLKLFDPTLPGKTTIATTQAINSNLYPHAEILILPKNKQGKVNLPTLLDELGKRGITSLLVEGGMKVHESFFYENLVNKVQVYLAPVVIGSMSKKIFSEVQMMPMGHDFHFSASYLNKMVN